MPTEQTKHTITFSFSFSLQAFVKVITYILEFQLILITFWIESELTAPQFSHKLMKQLQPLDYTALPEHD